MSLYIEFEPHSWYMGFAIADCYSGANGTGIKWYEAYGEDGMRGYIVEFKADTLKDIKQHIKDWHIKENERIKKLYENVAV